MKNSFVKIFLITTHILIALPIRLIFNVKSNSSELKILKGRKYIIASNHPTKIDPFIILASIPLNKYIKLVPIRFVTSEDYLSKWYYKPLLLSWGCVSNTTKNGKKPLDLLKDHLDKGETIFIFPKGELEKRGKNASPNVGVVYLEREVKNSYIIPVKVYIPGSLNIINLLKRNIKVEIKFREIFRHEKFSDDLQIMANDLMKRIENDRE